RGDPAHGGRAHLHPPDQPVGTRDRPGGVSVGARRTSGRRQPLPRPPPRGYHDKLHAWADGYRGRGWPPGTPEYLLRGYYRLLTGLGDLPHMITCAGDPTRHDRMLDMTGGDAAALAEVRTALDVIAAQDMPDLASGVRLAYHRDQLTERTTSVPVSRPAIWATLGQVTRAEALATSFTDPGRQAQALVRVAGALAQAGEQQQAEALARSITDPGLQAHALAQAADALAQAGQQQQAQALARPIPGPHALAQVADALAQAGQQQQAEAVARSINIPAWQAQALAQVAEALTEAGQLQQAEAAARSITDPGPR